MLLYFPVHYVHSIFALAREEWLIRIMASHLPKIDLHHALQCDRKYQTIHVFYSAHLPFDNPSAKCDMVVVIRVVRKRFVIESSSRACLQILSQAIDSIYTFATSGEKLVFIMVDSAGHMKRSQCVAPLLVVLKC